MRREGIVLILLSGIVALLLFLSLLFVWMGRHFASSGSAAVRSAEGSLCASAGMDYAAARLSREGYPLFSGDPADRGDDWTFREGTESPLAGAKNPSFSHGEAWRDVASGLARAGAYDAGIDDVSGSPDRDGDGRFSAWSGRLRGGGGPFGLPFSLRIHGRAGRIPVNAGSLLADDVNRTDCWTGVWAYHNGLAHALDNLGAILFPDDGTRPWRKDVPTSAPAKILWSRLGQDLIGSRPEGGWRSWKDVETALLLLGYAPVDIERIRAYVDLGPYLGMDAPNRTEAPTLAPGIYAPVGFSCAPREILQALWLYLTAPVHRDLRAGSAAAWTNVCTRMGPANIQFGQTGISGGGPSTTNIRKTLILFEDEAAALADEAVAFRAEGTWSWRGLQERLVSRAAAIFSRDHADLAAPASGTADALAASSWVRAKADLAFHAVAMDVPMFMPFPGAMSTGPFPLDHHLGGDYPFSAVRFFYLSRANIRDAYTNPAKDPYQWGLAHFNAAPSSAKRVTTVVPQGLSMSPPADFDVESRFAGGPRGEGERSLKGRYRARETLHFTSQEDLELLLGGSPYLESRGIVAEEENPLPAARRPALADTASVPARSYPFLATLPGWNARSGLGDPPWPPPPWPLFPRFGGGVSLASREGGARGATHYWPFAEDFDGDHATDFRCEPGLDADLGYPVDRVGLAAPGHPTTPLWCCPNLNVTVVRFQGPDVFPGMSGPVVSAFSMEAWMTPREAYGCGLSIFPFPIANREITVGMQRTDDLPNPTILPGWTPDQKWTLVTYKARWTIPGEVNAMGGWNFVQNLLLPDRDPSTGKVQTGALHVVVTVGIGPTGSHQARVFVDAVEVPGSPATFTGSDTPAPWLIQSLTPVDLKAHGLDEIRLYDRALSETEIRERYDLGRYAVPLAGPSTAAALLADPPPNPVYRSPLYRLGGGSALTHGQWRGITNAALDGKVRIRALVAGYGAAGTFLGAVPMEATDSVTDLSSLGPVTFVQYLVELYAPGAPPAALYDTPLFESIWLSAQRKGYYHIWDGWARTER